MEIIDIHPNRPTKPAYIPVPVSITPWDIMPKPSRNGRASGKMYSVKTRDSDHPLANTKVDRVMGLRPAKLLAQRMETNGFASAIDDEWGNTVYRNKWARMRDKGRA